MHLLRVKQPTSSWQDVHDTKSASRDEANGGHVEDSSETLLQNDTLRINCLRAFLLGTLLVVAIGLSAASYEIPSRLEHASFQTNFQRIASRISYNFVDNINTRIWTARTYALRTVSTCDGDILDINRQILDDFTIGSKTVHFLEGIQWSPIIWNETEKLNWEAYARQTIQENIPANAMDICYGGQISQSNETIADRENANHIFQISGGKQVVDNGSYPMSPIWKASPQPPAEALLFNQMRDPIREKAMLSMISTQLPTFAETRYPGAEYENLMNIDAGSPKSAIFYPVMGDGPYKQTVVGTIALDIVWNYVFGFSRTLPWSSKGVVMVVESNHGQSFTYQITDTHFASFLGVGDLHDPNFDSMVMNEQAFGSLKHSILKAAPDSNSITEDPKAAIVYNLRIYPSVAFKSQFITNKPWIYTSAVAITFIFTTTVCIAYDFLVRRRQQKVMLSVEQSNALLTSLFPDFIKTRLTARVDNTITNLRPRSSQHQKSSRFLPRRFSAPKTLLRGMLGKSGRRLSNVFKVSEPIADFFPNVTVIFADIAGFTAWSSERDPTQVFQLLEALYGMFDALADKHGVFKIETIGDCYVAVTGLHEPQADHAARMARFGHDIMIHMHELVASLESRLGPGTSSLSIRVGLHSGSVTGGVLRGDRARFQLFGDTMNMASRMQSTGEVDKIQVSESTANLLTEAGHGSWLEKRDSKVFVKGKGDMQTYWVNPTTNNNEDKEQIQLSHQITCPYELTHCQTFMQRDSLVKWNTDLLERFLKQLLASRHLVNCRTRRFELVDKNRSMGDGIAFFNDHKPIDDVTDLIVMSDFSDKKSVSEPIDSESVELGEAVCMQLKDYVHRIANMYRDNPVHNFEHASHVAMFASKIVKRIVRPVDIDGYHQGNIKNQRHWTEVVARQIHDRTFGVSLDASLVFAAVIHDVDHTGVSNAQLVKEQDDLAVKYENKSVAEQHSIRVAWDMLKVDYFQDLRACSYSSNKEKNRLRQLIVHAIIAQDALDSNLQLLRKTRWNKAFHDSFTAESVPPPMALLGDDHMSRKATVAFEYIFQAADMARTMQHRHIFCRWNERLFEEQNRAFLAGREEQDQSLGWYSGEMWFFDIYIIIPLARKLETCGVFGVSSDEFLNYSLGNPHEWKGNKGHEMMVQHWHDKYLSMSSPSSLLEHHDGTAMY
jgi:class 3 adenylate cyclase